jgi:hypothetical protein
MIFNNWISLEKFVISFANVECLSFICSVIIRSRKGEVDL